MSSPPLPDKVLDQLPSARFYKRRKQPRPPLPPFDWYRWRDVALTVAGALFAIATLSLLLFLPAGRGFF